MKRNNKSVRSVIGMCALLLATMFSLNTVAQDTATHVKWKPFFSPCVWRTNEKSPTVGFDFEAGLYKNRWYIDVDVESWTKNPVIGLVGIRAYFNQWTSKDAKGQFQFYWDGSVEITTGPVQQLVYTPGIAWAWQPFTHEALVLGFSTPVTSTSFVTEEWLSVNFYF